MKVFKMSELKLEIGAGEKPQPGYVHHDGRPLEGIDIVCDAREFPPEHKGKYDEVYASNIIEHFNRFDMPKVLRHWVELLKIGGRIKIITPDMEEITRQYVHRQITHEQFVYLCYGGNDYEFNKHYYCFSPNHMVQVFANAGLHTESCKAGKTWVEKMDTFYCPMIVATGIRFR